MTYITDIKVADKYVLEHLNVMWRGWEMVEVRPINFPPLHPNAFRINDQWYSIIKRIPLTRKGWLVE